MSRLIVCQLKQLLPFVMLWGALVVIYYGFEFSSDRIDELSYLDWCSDYCDAGSNFDMVLFTIFLYMIAAYSLFPREFDEGTIDFVRSMPISRGQIFIAKVLAAWGLICLLILAEAAIHSTFTAFNTQTLTGRNYWHNDLTFFLRNCLFAFVIVAHGVFISWFRTVGLILYSIFLVGLIWLEQSQGTSGTYNIFRFFNNEYFGQQLLIDWQVVISQLIAATILLIVSYVLWTRTDSKPRAAGAGRLSRYMPTILSVAAFILTASTLGVLMIQTKAENQVKQVQQLSSTHYHFAYKAADEQRLLELNQYADDDYLALAELLGVTDYPMIRADMTSENRHALGVATQKKILMVLSEGESVNPMYRRVLSHETAHVFQTTESQSSLNRAANSVGFFVEGMAQYTSFELVPDDYTRTTNWAISSVAWDRQNITFDAMTNRAAFESLHDPELLYGIGDIWVDAMVRQCGEESLGNFLRTLPDKSNPKNLFGKRYWRHHLGRIGCDLEEINHLWRQQMQQIIDTGTEGAFPTFSNVSTEQHDTQLVISATIETDSTGQSPVSYLIRVKGETAVARTVSPISNGVVSTDNPQLVEFRIPLAQIQGNRFSYQLGFVPYTGSRYYFDKWRNGTVPGQ